MKTQHDLIFNPPILSLTHPFNTEQSRKPIPKVPEKGVCEPPKKEKIATHPNQQTKFCFEKSKKLVAFPLNM